MGHSEYWNRICRLLVRLEPSPGMAHKCRPCGGNPEAGEEENPALKPLMFLFWTILKVAMGCSRGERGEGSMVTIEQGCWVDIQRDTPYLLIVILYEGLRVSGLDPRKWLEVV